MNSSQQDNIVRTNCKDCILAIYDKKSNSTQLGCLANRIEKFENVIEAYDDDKEFYVIERLCNYYRDNKDQYVKDNGEIDLEKIKQESSISFNLLFNCNDIDEEYSKYIISFYDNVKKNYGLNKVKITLCYSKAGEKEIQTIKNLRLRIDNQDLVFYRNTLYLHNLLLKSTKSYHCILTKNNRPSINILDKCNEIVNVELKKVVAFENNEFYIVSNLAYKVKHISLNSDQYGEIIDSIINESKEKELFHIIEL